MAVVIVVSAVAIANAPVVINNKWLFVNVLAIATIIVVKTIDATTRKTLGTALGSTNAFIPLTPTKLHREKTQ